VVAYFIYAIVIEGTDLLLQSAMFLTIRL